MAYDDQDALFVDPRPLRPEPPQPPPDTLQSLPNANPEATTCHTCGRAVMTAHVDQDGNCSTCANLAPPDTDAKTTPAPAPAPTLISDPPSEVEEGK